MDPKIQKAIAFLISKVKNLEDQLGQINHTVNEVLVPTLLEADEQYTYDTGLAAFREAHPEIAEVDPRMRGLMQDDAYDTTKAIYDQRPADLEDDTEWVKEVLAGIIARLDASKGEVPEEQPKEAVVEEETISEPEEDENSEEEVDPEEIKKALANY